jgi:LppX_LprAFG lipoprotein
MKHLIALFAIAVVCACTSGQNVNAAQVLKDGGAAMGQLKSANATLKLTKGAITIQTFKLVSAKTSVRLPSESDTIYTVKEEDVSFGLEVVIVPGHVYLHVPFSHFQEVTGPDAQAFPDMAKMFDPTTGLPAVIPQGTNPKYVSTDQVDGKDCYQIATTYTAAQVRGLISELDSSGPVDAHVWVGTDDHLIRKAVLKGAFGDSGTDATVEVSISAFNGPVVIASPTP